MFDVGMQELLVVFVVALIFIGPKKLPEIARSLGKMMGELKRAGDEIKEKIEFETMMEDTEEDVEEDRRAETSTPKAPDPPSSEAPQPQASFSQESQAQSIAHDQDQEKDPEKNQT